MGILYESIVRGQKKEKLKEIQSLINDVKDEGGTVKSISDGYHTFGELYHHRAVLFALICKAFPDLSWKSMHHGVDDGPMFDDMFIVGINTPYGQATYHYHVDPYYDTLFKNVHELANAPKWDGHSPDEAIDRIARMVLNNEKESTDYGI